VGNWLLRYITSLLIIDNLKFNRREKLFESQKKNTMVFEKNKIKL
jgi:hypothetical protein